METNEIGDDCSSSSGLHSTSEEDVEDRRRSTEDDTPGKTTNLMSQVLPSSDKIVSGLLENGLRYVIVPHFVPTNKVYANLAVSAGSLNEETEAEQGLAHFLEHCVFLGTEALPRPKDMEAVLTKLSMDCHADSNAYTTFRETAFTMQAPAVLTQKRLEEIKERIETHSTEGHVLEDICLEIPHHLRQREAPEQSKTNDDEQQFYSVEILLFLLHQLCFRASLSDRYAIERERGAVLSEAACSYSLDTRLDFQSYVQIHGETPIPRRFPIGRLEHIEKFTPEMLCKFYKQWYQPHRMTLYLSGVLDCHHVETTIQRLFSREKSHSIGPFPVCPKDCASLEKFKPVPIDTTRKDCNSATSRPLRWSQPSPLFLPGCGYPYGVPLSHSFDRSPKQPIVITQHPLISTFSFTLTLKQDLEDCQLASHGQMKESVCDIILSQVLQSRLNELRSSVSRPPFRNISWESNHASDEGCSVASLNVVAESGVQMRHCSSQGSDERWLWVPNQMRFTREDGLTGGATAGKESGTNQNPQTDENKVWYVWQEAVAVGIRECVRLSRFGVPPLELETAIRAVGKAFRDRAAAADAVDSLTMLDECVEALQTSSSLMDRRVEYEAFQRVAELISTEDLKERAAKVFGFIERAAEVGSNISEKRQRMADVASNLDKLESSFHSFETKTNDENNSSIGLGNSWSVVRSPEMGHAVHDDCTDSSVLGFSDICEAIGIFISAPGPVVRTNLRLNPFGDVTIPGIGNAGEIDSIAVGFAPTAGPKDSGSQRSSARDQKFHPNVRSYSHSYVASEQEAGTAENRYGVGVFADVRIEQVLDALKAGLAHVKELPDIHMPERIVSEDKLQKDMETFKLNASELNVRLSPGQITRALVEDIFVDAPFKYSESCNSTVDWGSRIADNGLTLEVSCNTFSNGLTLTCCPTPFEAGTIHVLAIARGGQSSEGLNGWRPKICLPQKQHVHFPPGTNELAIATIEDSGASDHSSETLIRIVSGWGVHGEITASTEEVVAHTQLSSAENDGPDKALQLIRAMLWHSHWDDSAFNRALDTTYLEATAVHKDLERKSTYEHMKAMFHNDPRFVVCDENQILQLSKDTVRPAFESLWTPNNVQILVVGDIDHSTGLAATEKWLGCLPPTIKAPSKCLDPEIEELPSFKPPCSLISPTREGDGAVCMDRIKLSGQTCSVPDSSKRAVLLLSLPCPGRYNVNYCDAVKNLGTSQLKSPIDISNVRSHPMFPLRAAVVWVAVLERRLYEALRVETGNCYSCSVTTSAFEFFSPGFALIEATPLINSIPQTLGDALHIIQNLVTLKQPITEEECNSIKGSLVEDLKSSQTTNDYWIGQLQHLYCHGSIKSTKFMNHIASFYSRLTAKDLNYAIGEFYDCSCYVPVHATVGYSGLRHPVPWNELRKFVEFYLWYRYASLGKLYRCLDQFASVAGNVVKHTIFGVDGPCYPAGHSDFAEWRKYIEGDSRSSGLQSKNTRMLILLGLIICPIVVIKRTQNGSIISRILQSLFGR